MSGPAPSIVLAFALIAGAAAAQTLSGPVTNDPNAFGRGMAERPFDRNLGPPGEPQAAGTLPMDPAPITSQPSSSPLVPRPAPGSEGPEEAGRLAVLPNVQDVPAWESDRTADGAPALEPASYARGELIAMGGGLVQNAGNACILCHGPRGAGDGSGAIPRIAGLPAWYLSKQLVSYAEGTRRNEIMQQVSSTLSRQDMLDLGRYYAALQAPLGPAPQVTDPGLLQHGARIGSQGLRARMIPACETCHAADGAGQPPDVPYLAGQYAAYIEAQLTAWQIGTRANDPSGIMVSIARKMTAEDIRAVALYYESVRGAP
jgi:cytochrome c553